MSANLPADATTGQSFTTSMEVIDSLGVSHTVGQTWTKTGDNTWSLALANPTLTSDTSTTSGVVSPSSVTVTFNTDGSLASTTSLAGRGQHRQLLDRGGRPAPSPWTWARPAAPTA
jgi:flagellar hook protein FlgE